MWKKIRHKYLMKNIKEYMLAETLQKKYLSSPLLYPCYKIINEIPYLSFPLLSFHLIYPYHEIANQKPSLSSHLVHTLTQNCKLIPFLPFPPLSSTPSSCETRKAQIFLNLPTFPHMGILFILVG